MDVFPETHRWPTGLRKAITRDTRSQSAARCHLTPVTMAAVDSQTHTKRQGGCGEKGALVHGGWEGIWCSRPGKQEGGSSETLHVRLPEAHRFAPFSDRSPSFCLWETTSSGHLTVPVDNAPLSPERLCHTHAEGAGWAHRTRSAPLSPGGIRVETCVLLLSRGWKQLGLGPTSLLGALHGIAAGQPLPSGASPKTLLQTMYFLSFFYKLAIRTYMRTQKSKDDGGVSQQRMGGVSH